MYDKTRIDYIYKDLDSQKQVGEIQELNISPHITFSIYIENGVTLCHLYLINKQWNLHIINDNKNISLSHLSDTFWNSDAIGSALNSIDAGIKIAYAIQSIYTNNRMMFEVLRL